MPTSITCAQLAPRVGDIDGNVRRSVAAIRTAADSGAELIVLPELATSGYVFSSAEEARGLAEPADGPALASWSEAARETGAVVVGGFAELGDDGALYNAAAVVDSSGVVAVYRKTHLWDREKLVFEPGAELPPVVETAVGRVGVLVCYDLEFPENARSLALRGAEVIAVPTNWPIFPRPAGERPPEVLNLMTLARFNRVFIAAADRVGTERGQEWTGGTSIVDCDGWLVAEAPNDDTALISGVVELERSRDKVWTDHADLFADRRPELYGALTQTVVSTGG